MKQDKLKLYILDMKYVRDLHNVDDRVQSISPQIHKSKRLCTKELDWIQNQDAIVKKANKLYRLCIQRILTERKGSYMSDEPSVVMNVVTI